MQLNIQHVIPAHKALPERMRYKTFNFKNSTDVTDIFRTFSCLQAIASLSLSPYYDIIPTATLLLKSLVLLLLLPFLLFH